MNLSAKAGLTPVNPLGDTIYLLYLSHTLWHHENWQNKPSPQILCPFSSLQHSFREKPTASTSFVLVFLSVSVEYEWSLKIKHTFLGYLKTPCRAPRWLRGCCHPMDPYGAFHARRFGVRARATELILASLKPLSFKPRDLFWCLLFWWFWRTCFFKDLNYSTVGCALQPSPGIQGFLLHGHRGSSDSSCWLYLVGGFNPSSKYSLIWIIIPKKVEKHLWNYQVRIVWWKVDSINVRYTPYTATLCYPDLVAYIAYSGNPPRRSLFAAVPRRRRLRTASSFARLQRSVAPPQATRSRRNAARASGERRRNAPAAKGLNRKDIKIWCGNWNKLNHSTIWRMTISWWKKMMMQGGLWKGAGSVKTVANLHFKPFASLCRKWLIVLAVLV